MRLASVLKDEFDIEPKLVPGRGGIFDVVVDGRMIFSKHREGRFPDEEEILKSIHLDSGAPTQP